MSGRVGCETRAAVISAAVVGVAAARTVARDGNGSGKVEAMREMTMGMGAGLEQTVGCGRAGARERLRRSRREGLAGTVGRSLSAAAVPASENGGRPAAEADSVRTRGRCRGMVRTLRAQAAVEEVREAEVEVEAYRRYTEAMLRRFGKLKMEAGRTPSLLGREMFRGKVTHYKVSGFDDVVIFCHDVEGCLAGLGMRQQMLLRKIGVQRYTQAEAAATMGLSLRHAVRLYWAALDDLTRVFLERRLLERLR